MSATNNTREQQLRTVTAVLRAIPDRADQRAVLDALFAEPRVIAPRGFKGPARADRDAYHPCGSGKAYQAHRRRGEPVDEACRRANAREENERRARRRATQKQKEKARAA